MKFDPWNDAKTLAQRLAQPEARLVVVVAALTWCQKCRDYLPTFEHQAANAPDIESHVWLDIEEHGTFLGSFVPDDLPLQLTYESGQLKQVCVLRTSGDHEPQDIDEPGIYARLCTQDWAI